MKKFTVFSLICFLSGFMLIACQRDRGVHAGNDSDTYQPRRAPARHVTADQGIKGELLRVDVGGKTVSVRLENGMVQTFKFDNDTIVSGLENQPQTNTAKNGLANNHGVRQ